MIPQSGLCFWAQNVLLFEVAHVVGLEGILLTGLLGIIFDQLGCRRRASH